MGENEHQDPTESQVITDKIDKGVVSVKTSGKGKGKKKQKKQDSSRKITDNAIFRALKELFDGESGVTSTQIRDKAKTKNRGVVRRAMKRLAKQGIVRIDTNDKAKKGEVKYTYHVV